MSIYSVFLGNYFFASAISYLSVQKSVEKIGMFELFFGILTGLFFLLNFFLYQRNIHKNGLSISVGVMRMAVLIPTMLSVLVFKDSFYISTMMGLIVILLTFGLMIEKNNWRNSLLLLLLFVVAGTTDSTLKIFNELGGADSSFFIFVLFSSAFLWNLILIMVLKEKISIRFFLIGMLIGIPNMYSTRFFLAGLQSINATIAYPLTASGIVIFSLLSDHFFWKRKFSFKQKIAFVMLIAGIVLINLK